VGTVLAGGELAGEKDAVRDENEGPAGGQKVLCRDAAEDGQKTNFLQLFGISREKEGLKIRTPKSTIGEEIWG
jgi:hypothetical protein